MRKEAKAQNAVAGAIVGGLVGAFAGPAGIVVGAPWLAVLLISKIQIGANIALQRAPGELLRFSHTGMAGCR
jgi:uncharacterized protein YqgC (DUF456 family)